MTPTLRHLFAALSLSASLAASAVTIGVGDSLYNPDLTGTVRAKYELRTSDGAGRFVLKNAIAGITGKVLPELSYRLEVDFHNDGKMKMRNAYARFSPKAGYGSATFGYMRVPVGIDVQRSPHQQYFANRSFMAKYGCNLRETGLSLVYKVPVPFSLALDGGVFSGSSTRDGDEDGWSNAYVFTFRALAVLDRRWGLSASVMRTRPDLATVMHYGAGAYYDDPLWHFEAEYLHKHYSHDVAPGAEPLRRANFVNAFAVRRFPIGGGRALSQVSALGRYDYISRHSLAKASSAVEPARHRMTLGATLHFGVGPVYAEARLNYENYFYPSTALPTPDEDKLVLELMCRF